MWYKICETRPGLLETLHVPEFPPPVANVIALTGILTGITPIPVLKMISWSIWFPAIKVDVLNLTLLSRWSKSGFWIFQTEMKVYSYLWFIRRELLYELFAK